MTPQLKRRLINTEEYHLMAKVGILGEDDRVELINGEIITEISLFDHEGEIHFPLLDLSVKGSQLLG